MRDIALDRTVIAEGTSAGSLTPVVSWSTPVGRSPTDYSIVVYRLTAESPNARPVAQLVIDSGAQEVRIPPGVLAAGQRYAIER